MRLFEVQDEAVEAAKEEGSVAHRRHGSTVGPMAFFAPDFCAYSNAPRGVDLHAVAMRLDAGLYSAAGTLVCWGGVQELMLHTILDGVNRVIINSTHHHR